MASYSRDLLNNYLNEVLEDCRTFGPAYKCYYYLDRKTGAFCDYSLEQEKIMNIDETTKQTTLFDLLCLFVALDLSSRRCFTPTAAIIVACRNISSLTQTKYAEKIGVSVKVLSAWEQGARNASLNNMLSVCKIIGLDYNSFFETYNNLLAFEK